jgi:dolichol-phosphate mannosyltransferase
MSPDMAMFYGLSVTVGWFFTDRLVEGWTSTVVILSFLGGVNLMMFGVVGLYVGRIYEQVKNRPLYIVDAADDRGADSQGEANVAFGSSAGEHEASPATER